MNPVSDSAFAETTHSSTIGSDLSSSAITTLCSASGETAIGMLDSNIRIMISGGGGTRCTGDVMEIRAQVSAVTDDPIPANNTAIASVERENNPSLISGCPGEGLLTSEDGGGSVGVLLLGGLAAVFLARRRRFRAVQTDLCYQSFAVGRPTRDYWDRQSPSLH